MKATDLKVLLLEQDQSGLLRQPVAIHQMTIAKDIASKRRTL